MSKLICAMILGSAMLSSIGCGETTDTKPATTTTPATTGTVDADATWSVGLHAVRWTWRLIYDRDV